jgi:membrane fusion protein, multidrug efflux system
MTSKRRLWGIASALALLLGAGVFIGVKVVTGSKAAAPQGGAAVPVTVATVATKSVPVKLYAIGNVEPFTTVALKARVDGEIVAVKFKEGEEVRQGAVLFEIDRRPFEAMLKQAEANLLKDRALYDHTVEQEKRYRDLLEKKFISTDGYEQVKTNMDTAAAQLRADEAGIENSKLSLEYCTIRSPVAGYAGKIQIQQGNLVKANDTTPLVVLNQIVPIYTSFSVPEQYLADVRRYQADGALRVTAAVANSTHPAVSGKLSFIDNSTDVTTGTIKLKAEFANTDKALWPGQFVNVVLTLAQQKGAIVTPAVSLQNGPNGQYVFVVKSDQTVELRQVSVSRTEGDDAVIASGLAPGDRVVTTGQLRLAPGMRVSIGQGKASESSASAGSS